MTPKLAVFLALAFVPTILSITPQANYNGYQVFTLILESDSQLTYFHDVISDIWKEPATLKNTPLSHRATAQLFAEVMVFPDKVDEFKEIAEYHQIPASIKISDVGALIQSQESPVAEGLRAVDWLDYYRFDELDAWVLETVNANSDIASVRTVATSTEGRPVRVVKVSKPGSPANKSAILVDGGFHAREWISPAISTYIINELLNNRAANSDVLDAVDMYIIPVVNPDGYEFSHTNNRLWRKTRSDHDSILGCIGVDPNRNYDFQFGGPGTSNDKCSEIYRGPSAFSEPEVRGVRDVILDSSVNWAAYFTIHSYGLMWLTPWSYTLELPTDYAELMAHGAVGAAAIREVHGTQYRVGATTEVYGETAGCADDWAKSVGVKYAVTIEVRDKGAYGFLLPKAQILPTCEETWAGIRALAFYDY